MKLNHRKFSLWLALVALMPLASLLGMSLSGCEASNFAPTQQYFASLRVMNFAQLPAASFDVYWWKDGDPTPTQVTQANIHNLGYGGGAVYTNDIYVVPGGSKYHYMITVANNPQKVNATGDLTLQPGLSYTLLVTSQTSGSVTNYSTNLITDRTFPTGADSKDTTLTFVRVINMQPGSGNIAIHVNDPVNGEVIDLVSGTGKHGIGLGEFTDYYPIHSKTDTSYSFFATAAGGSSLILPGGVLTYQTYPAGNYTTLIYAGDSARMPGDSANYDTTRASLDNVRLRAFDDNNLGNDQTNPLEPSIRYNIINGIIPPGGVYPSTFGASSTLGFIINGNKIPKNNNFTFWPVPALTPAGAGYLFDPTNNDWDVRFAATSIPTVKMELQGYATDASGLKQSQLFDFNPSGTPSDGLDPKYISHDSSFTIVFVNGDSILKKPLRFGSFGVPSSSDPNSIILEFVDAIGFPVGSAAITTFKVTTPDGNTQTLPPLNFSPPTLKPDQLIISGVSGEQDITVSDVLGTQKKIPGPTMTFKAYPGGIYEVVAIGNANTSQIFAMRLNK